MDKTKTDKFINGELVTKVRPLIEPLIFPESKIIKDFSTSDKIFILIVLDLELILLPHSSSMKVRMT